MHVPSAVYGPPHSCPRTILVAGPAEAVVRLAQARGIYQGVRPGPTVSAVEIRATVWEAEEVVGQLARAGVQDVWVASEAGGVEG